MKQIRIENKEQYVQILDFLKDKSKYLEIVIPDYEEKEAAFRLDLTNRLLTEKRVNRWQGTKTTGLFNTLYKYDLDKESSNTLFKSLKKSEPFFINTQEIRFGYLEDTVIETEFGHIDFAFYGFSGDVFFYTTTHEGIAFISDSY